MTRCLFALCCLAVSMPALGEPAWPHCGVRVGGAGGPAIVVNGAPKIPVLFSGNNQFGRDEVLLEELRLAAQAGIPFFSVNMELDGYLSDAQADERLDRFCAAHPEGYFLLRTWVGPTGAWIAAHPEACITNDTGASLNLASPSSRAWREDTAGRLRARLQHLLQGPHAARFLGIALHYLQTAEWFYPQTDDYMDYSPVNLAAFHEWLHKQYTTDAALQQAWNQPQITFATAALPTREEREATALGPFRDPRRQRPAMDLHRFQNELIADSISYFAQVVKGTTQGRSLVASFYGYLFELNANGPRALAHSGHLALGALLENPNIDIVLAPYAYFDRGLGQPGTFHFPVDSLALHGKLGILEEDTYTHLSYVKPEERLIAPGWNNRTQSMSETLSINRRNVLNFLEHRCGLWYFDLLSDGRWNSAEFWNATQPLWEAARSLQQDPTFRPEIAFVADEQSVGLLADTTAPELTHALCFWRFELGRMGAPVGYYLLSDLKRLPDSVRMLILPNAYDAARVDGAALQRVLDRGGAVLWAYTPGIMTGTGPESAGITKTTGFAVKTAADGVAMRSHAEGSAAVEEYDLAPMRLRAVIEAAPDIEVLARYAGTEEISAACRKAGPGTVAFTAIPRLSVELLRQLARKAHVRLVLESPGGVAVAGAYVAVHTGETAQDTVLSWPAAPRAVQRVFPEPAQVTLRDGVLRDSLPAKTTVLYKAE